MNRADTRRHQWVLWGLLLGLWCSLVLTFAGQLVLLGWPWTQALGAAARDWLPWAVLTPIVAWLALTFPLERQKLRLSIPLHVVGCLLALLFYEFVALPLPAVLGPNTARFSPGPPDEALPDGPLHDGPLRDGPPFGPGPGRREPGFGPGGLGRPRPALGRTSFTQEVIRHSRFNIPIYWVIVSLVHALTYYRRSEEGRHRALELEGRLATAKLDALRMQLHPHFLFNTLNAISTLVHKDPAAADEMIANLSELLRATLDTAEQEIPLEQELTFLERYLEIQQVRFGDRLEIVKQIDASTLRARVPTLILQPLVENAVRHGIEPQTTPGVIRIEASRNGDMLHLAVKDNGVGAKLTAKTGEGIGLANTRSRLLQLYGNAARVILNTGNGGGFGVELEIPFCEGPCHAPSPPPP